MKSKKEQKKICQGESLKISNMDYSKKFYSLKNFNKIIVANQIFLNEYLRNYCEKEKTLIKINGSAKKTVLSVD
jgi:hypothetical protein